MPENAIYLEDTRLANLIFHPEKKSVQSNYSQYFKVSEILRFIALVLTSNYVLWVFNPFNPLLTILYSNPLLFINYIFWCWKRNQTSNEYNCKLKDSIGPWKLFFQCRKLVRTPILIESLTFKILDWSQHTRRQITNKFSSSSSTTFPNSTLFTVNILVLQAIIEEKPIEILSFLSRVIIGNSPTQFFDNSPLAYW